jgi:hypothetical protein
VAFKWPLGNISHGIVSLFHILEMTKVIFMKFSGGITNGLGFHAASFFYILPYLLLGGFGVVDLEAFFKTQTYFTVLTPK